MNLSRLCFALLTVAAVATVNAEGPPQRIIVKYRADAVATSNIVVSPTRKLSDAGSRFGTSLSSVRITGGGAHVVRLGSEISKSEVAQLVADFKADPDVGYAEEDLLMQPVFTPNDPQYNQQWHYFESAGGLNLPAAWDVSTGSGVVVAVIDTGYRPHADLVANILPGYDFISDTFVSRDGNLRDSSPLDQGDWTTGGDCYAGSPARSSSWHGTHVSGTVAAITNNSTGVAGVAFNARVLPVRVLGRCGGYTSDIADAIVWASGGTVSGVPANPNPAKVASLSLGGQSACGTTTQNAINSARGRGTVVIVAAGNSNANASAFSPANCTNVVVVASVGRNGGRAYYTNFGSIVDVAAPGGDTRAGAANGVLSTLNTGTTTPGSDAYAFYQGTSMATPHVSGVAALMLSVNPSLTPTQIETRLKSTTRTFPASCSQCGTGIVNAAAAVAAAP